MLNPLFENQGIRFQLEVLISKLSVLISSQFWFSITLIHFIYLKTPPSCSETVLKFWFSVTLIISFLCKHQCLVQRRFRIFYSVLHSMTHPFNFFENTNGLFKTVLKLWISVILIHFISLKTPLACSERVLRLCSYILALHHPAFLFSLFRCFMAG